MSLDVSDERKGKRYPGRFRASSVTDALQIIRTRRSYGRTGEPGPTDEELRRILEAGASAPDHGNLRPFRFTVLRGEGLKAFGEVLEEAYRRRCAGEGIEPAPAKAQKERTKLGRAPLVVAVCARRQDETKIPWVEQRDAAVAASTCILLAAHALGYGAMWRSGEACDDEYVKEELGCASCDAVVGFLYIGTPRERKPPREIGLSELVTEYEP